MSGAFGQGQSLSADRQPCIRMPEQPISLRPHVAGTSTRVVAAIELSMRPMPFGIVQSAAHVAVLTRGRRLTGEQTGRPGAVVRLQTQSFVGLVGGQLQQSMRELAPSDDP